VRFLSLCSGIEAASAAWQPLGWTAAGFAEIEPFCCALLKHHYPDVPNYGDLTKITKDQIAAIGSVDLVCGGTPCQSFSVAGLRKGLADPRGNLTLRFVQMVEMIKPHFVVWENVPGILSDSTQALEALLDGLEEVGYAIVGFDILDAQFFGVAQRRRRVFVCGENIDYLLSQKTVSSGLIAAQCLAEIWQGTLGVLRERFNPGVENSDSASFKFIHSLRKRINLFGLQKAERVSKLLDCLAALLPSSECGPCGLGSGSGKASSQTRESIEDTKSGESEILEGSTSESKSTEQLWRSILESGLLTASECITSTSISETTESKIYSCALAMLNTAAFMRASLASSPAFSVAAASCLTGIKECTDYARLAVNSLFTEVGWVCRWRDFLRQAVPVCESLGDIRIRSFGQVLPLRESLSGNPPPSRETGAIVAHSLARGSCGSRCTTAPSQPQMIVAFDTTQITSLGNYSNPQPGEPCHPLAKGQHPPAIAFQSKQSSTSISPSYDETSPTLDTAKAGGIAVLSESQPTHSGYQVRRLTVEECEALQGFPRGYTAIPYRGKPAVDGPRYRALGNSMAVPVMRWIGGRILEVTRNTVKPTPTEATR
jgi:DNA-cytosine methyltransferase